MHPAGLFIVTGLTNTALGLIYRLPMPLQPRKVIAASAIAPGWSTSLIHASGLGVALIWLAPVLGGPLRKLLDVAPTFNVRCIQPALTPSLASVLALFRCHREGG